MIFITTLAGIPKARAVHTKVLRAAWVESTSHFGCTSSQRDPDWKYVNLTGSINPQSSAISLM